MKKIILTEDDPGIQDVLQLVLKRADYEVVLYTDGMVLLKDAFEVPDIFLIDKQLSGVDGLDICRHLKSMPRTAGIPIIILSATPHIQLLAQKARADAFVEKPFSNKELLKLVAYLLCKPDHNKAAQYTAAQGINLLS